jgi:hypothetical protein
MERGVWLRLLTAWGCGLALAAVAPAAAAAAQLVDPAGAPVRGPYQAWADASHMPALDGRVTLRIERCPPRPAVDGCVLFSSPREIYLRPDADMPRLTLLHELGHLFDLHFLDDGERQALKALLRQEGRDWWHGAEPPGERFAEAYALCARYRRLRRIPDWTSYSYRPTLRRHRAICKRIRRAAAEGGRLEPATAPTPQTAEEPPRRTEVPPPSDEPPPAFGILPRN